MRIDEGAQRVIETLERAGYEAYAVGGCVRDALMGVVPDDWDITTSALPEEVKALFPRTFDTGIQHGTVTVLIDQVGYEVTTYRVDGSYSDHRRPDRVAFTSSLYEDVARRDFTINSMAYHPKRGLVDYFDGRKDLSRKVIRCVGDPEKRFDEDALRMLRAVRFASRLQFSIEEKTYKAIIEQAIHLEAVSKERILEELTKTLLCSHPEGLFLAEDTGLAAHLAISLRSDRQLDYEAPSKVRADKALRFAALLYPLGKDRAAKVMKELKSDNDTLKRCIHLIEHIDDASLKDEFSMRMLMHEVGKEQTPDLLQLKLAAGKMTAEDFRTDSKLYESQKNAPVTLKELKITGKDLIALGIGEGKEVGRVLEQLLLQVLEDPSENEKEKLTRRLLH